MKDEGYKISIWSAGSKNYVKLISDYLKKYIDKYVFVWSLAKCKQSLREYETRKALELIKWDQGCIKIIDDDYGVYERYPSDTIPIPSFVVPAEKFSGTEIELYMSSHPKDTELKKIIENIMNTDMYIGCLKHAPKIECTENICKVHGVVFSFSNIKWGHFYLDTKILSISNEIAPKEISMWMPQIGETFDRIEIRNESEIWFYNGQEVHTLEFVT